MKRRQLGGWGYLLSLRCSECLKRQLYSEVEFTAVESRRWDYCIQINEEVRFMVCCYIKGSGLATFGRNHLPRGTVFRLWYLRKKTRVDIFCTHGQHSHLDSHEGFAVLQF